MPAPDVLDAEWVETESLLQDSVARFGRIRTLLSEDDVEEAAFEINVVFDNLRRINGIVALFSPGLQMLRGGRR